MLYVHETFILLMLLAGGRARWLARSLPESGEPLRGSHRLAGRLAIIFGILALLTALVVLANLTRHGLESVPEVAAQDSSFSLGHNTI